MTLFTVFPILIVKRFLRSPAFGKELAIQIVLGILLLVIAAYFVISGIYLETAIVQVLKQTDPVAFLNGVLIYYFFIEFVIRYFVQSLPTLEIGPLLHLPIKRRSIANFFLGISLLHAINAFVFLLFVPFALGAVAEAYGIFQAWVWIFSLWLISMTIHYLIVLLKISSSKIEWKLSIAVLVCCLFAYADYSGWIRLSSASERLFSETLKGYSVAGVLLLVVFVMHLIAHRATLKRLYPDELGVKGDFVGASSDLSFLKNWGQTSLWVKLELKMIFRNARTREVFFMSTMFVVQDFVLCNVMENRDYGVFLFIGIAATGLFMANYGQHTFSWQGDHFDFTLTRPVSIRSYVESKCLLLALMTGFWFIFTIPVAFFWWDIFLINLAGALYNIGVNTFVVMNMSMLDTNKLTLKSGGALNYEGAGAAQWLIGVPFLFIPTIIYAAFTATGYRMLGIAAVGLLGLIGIILFKQNVNFTYKRFLEKRYKIASSFRKK